MVNAPRWSNVIAPLVSDIAVKAAPTDAASPLGAPAAIGPTVPENKTCLSVGSFTPVPLESVHAVVVPAGCRIRQLIGVLRRIASYRVNLMMSAIREAASPTW